MLEKLTDRLWGGLQQLPAGGGDGAKMYFASATAIEEKKKKKREEKAKKKRLGVSGDTDEAPPGQFTLKVTPKSDAQRASILAATRRSGLFAALDDQQRDDAVNAMFSVTPAHGTEVRVPAPA